MALEVPWASNVAPQGNLGMMVEVGAEGEDDSFGEAEYAAINSTLGQINSCLDHLKKNDHLHDHLHVRLQELLEFNWQSRFEFQFDKAPRDASP